MNALNQSICIEAQHIHTNALFVMTQVLVVIFNFTGILQCTYITLFIASIQLFSVNFRILMFNLSLAIVMRSSLTFYRSSRYLIKAVTYHNSCELVAQEKYCFIQSVIDKMPLETSAYCFLVIGAERLLACLVYCRYERIRRPILGLILAPLPWIYPIFTMIEFLRMPTESNVYLVYCSSLTSSAFNRKKLLQISIPSVILCAIIFLFIYFLSKKELTLSTSGTVQSLSSRFQLKENFKTAKLLAIASFVYTMTSLTDMLIVIGMGRFLKQSQPNYTVWQAFLKECSSLSMPIFINIYSLLFICGHDYFKQHTISLLRCHRSITDKSETKIAPPMTTENHMEIIERIWINGR